MVELLFLDGIDASLVDGEVLGVGPAGIDIVYQRLGDRDAPPVLLIMGGGAQMIHWPDEFFHSLAEKGLMAIRFDNRDVGLSTHLTDRPAPDLPAVLAGDHASVSYTLSDMAADAVGLMNAMGMKKAHIVGASMGGQIAQTIAIEHPERVRSLVSMMSTTGEMRVGQPAPDVLREVFGEPPALTREDIIRQRVKAMKAIGSPAYPSNEDELIARESFAYDRGHDPIGFARQAIATVASGDRTERLRQLKIPALVIHGLGDRLVDVSGGKATADAIPDAELVLIEGMGHGLPHGLRQLLAERIAEFVWRVERNQACHA